MYNGYYLYDIFIVCGRSGRRYCCVHNFHDRCLRIAFHSPRMSPTNRISSAQPPVTQTIMVRRLRFFGHVVRSDSDEDHTRALNAGIDDPLKKWRRPRGRPRQTWLRTIKNDLKQHYLEIWSARHRAYDRELWRDIVETPTLQQGQAT